MISEDAVFDSVRRGYSELQISSNDEILAYFSEVDQESVIGHTSNIKGILFEQIYINNLAGQGVHASVFENTNHPVTDITIFDNEIAIHELQLKATDSTSYIFETLDTYPNVGIVTTSEVAEKISTDLVINSGIENSALEESIRNTLFDESVNPISPFSVIGWIFGFPF